MQDNHPKDKFSEVLDENKESPRREFYEKLMNDDQIIVPEGEGETDTSRTVRINTIQSFFPINLMFWTLHSSFCSFGFRVQRGCALEQHR